MTTDDKVKVIQAWTYGFSTGATPVGRVYGMIWYSISSRTPRFTMEYCLTEDMINDVYEKVKGFIWDNVYQH